MHLFLIILAAILTASWLSTPSDDNSRKPISPWTILIPVGAAILGILLMSLT